MTRAKPGAPCWRASEGNAGRFLIDASSYYLDLYRTLRHAQRRVMLLGWDVDSRTELAPGAEDAAWPGRLDAFLKAAVKRNPELEIYILTWDFFVIYQFEREVFTQYKIRNQGPSRLRFVLDSEHPVWSSHHQKVVVVDDEVAYLGGIDVTANRWDTSRHGRDERRRVSPSGKPYAPFHDVQVRLEGPVAHDVAELARTRWLRATGEKLEPVSLADHAALRQTSLPHDFSGARIALSRTEPAFKGRPEVRESEAMLVELIARAQSVLYIENQYFTSRVIVDALKRSLERPDGPEVIIVLPKETKGWLETRTMGALRNYFVAELEAADRFRRLGMFYPAIDPSADVMVHSKVMIVDDEAALVGSANLNNRSMGFDTELNATLEAAGDERVRAAIRLFRATLCGEHLGLDPARLAEAPPASFLALIRERQAFERCLAPLPPESNDWLGEAMVNLEVIDLERPFKAERLFDNIGDEVEAHKDRVLASFPHVLGMWAGASLLAFVLVGFTPLHRFFDVADLLELFATLKASGYTAPSLIAVYLVGAVLFVPINFLILATAVIFDWQQAIAYAAVGATANALLGYQLGRLSGARLIRLMLRFRIDRLARYLSREGVLPIFLLRLIPFAPYSVVNIIAGAAAVDRRKFLIGTLLGILPGAATLILFQKSLIDVILQPDFKSIITFASVVIVITTWLVFVRRRLKSLRERWAQEPRAAAPLAEGSTR